VATISQFGAGVGGNHNTASITQSGSGNLANISQAGGAGNHATVVQNP
jgi:hypothetical protein